MRRITFLLAAALALGASVDVFAQGFGGGGGQSFSGGGSSFGGGGSSFGGGGSSFGGGGSSFGGGGSSFGGGGSNRGGTSFSGGGTQFSGGQSFSGGTGFAGSTGRTGPGGRPAGRTGGTGTVGVSIDSTNFLAASYGNPLYLGRPGGQTAGATGQGGGGFGQPSLGAYQTTVIQNTGALSGRTGTTGLGATALGGRGATGMTGRTGTASVGGGFAGITLGGAAPITYAARVEGPPAPTVSPQVRTALQDLISRSSAIRQPAAVNITIDGETVVLRGRVASDEERRLIEGMVRLEPGVREVRNELEVR